MCVCPSMHNFRVHDLGEREKETEREREEKIQRDSSVLQQWEDNSDSIISGLVLNGSSIFPNVVFP